MNSVLLGGIIGVVLALLNFLSGLFLSSKILTVSKLTSVALALGEFIGRMSILTLLFYGLSKVKGVHFQTTLLAFALCFTLCLILKTMRFYRELAAYKQKTTEI